MNGMKTMKRRLACTVDDLKPGESMTLTGDEIALHRAEDGTFFATADSCTHEKWSLGSEGEIEGNEIVCPLHLARFEMASGKPLCLPATVALATYQVEVDGDRIYIIS